MKMLLENTEKLIVNTETPILSLFLVLVLFYGISTILGYLMPKPFLCI